jgi:four helix bundle protein
MTAELLRNRTKQFAVDIARLCEELPPRMSILAYSKQLIRSSSSVGANYRAACRAKSTADFINKLKITEEEPDESIYFLELLLEFDKTEENKIKRLIELLAIIVASINTARKKKMASNLKSSI